MISPLGSRYAIGGALGRSVKRAAAASAFVPTDISGCRLWLDFSDADYLFTDAGTTKVSTDGNAIYQVNDKSGNNYNVIQATEARRPLYKTGANGINSKSIALFDGDDDYLRLAVENWLSGDSQGSVFVVYQLTEDKTGVLLMSSDEKSTTRYLLFFGNHTAVNGIYILQNDAGTNDGNYGNTNPASGTVYLACFRSSGTAYSLRVNAADETVTTIVGANSGDWFADTSARDNLIIGANVRTTVVDFYKGKIAEIIVYNSNLTGTDLSNVETYLNNKWAIYS